MKTKINNTIIIDDHKLFAEGLARILSDIELVQLQDVIASEKELPELLDCIDLILLDIQLKEENGLDIAKRIKTNYPQIKIIFISMFDPKALVQEIKRSEANGFIPKSTDAKEVKEVIMAVLQGEDVFLEMDMQSYLPQPLFKLISKREKEIILLIKEGKTAKQIADMLHISQFTVDTHRKNILKKLELNSIKDLIAFSFHNLF
ncbi:response regulator transcription factor [Flavobacterium sp. J27]|uniref:response regulator n=1 Tax=Flavobacterium sp. J27 TaxID=2060419 RepID=UPI001031C4BA|nr:response regulator transcription factor [Flavobacterium sp. J27]